MLKMIHFEDDADGAVCKIDNKNFQPLAQENRKARCFVRSNATSKFRHLYYHYVCLILCKLFHEESDGCFAKFYMCNAHSEGPKMSQQGICSSSSKSKVKETDEVVPLLWNSMLTVVSPKSLFNWVLQKLIRWCFSRTSAIDRCDNKEILQECGTCLHHITMDMDSECRKHVDRKMENMSLWKIQIPIDHNGDDIGRLWKTGICQVQYGVFIDEGRHQLIYECLSSTTLMLSEGKEAKEMILEIVLTETDFEVRLIHSDKILLIRKFTGKILSNDKISISMESYKQLCKKYGTLHMLDKRALMQEIIAITSRCFLLQRNNPVIAECINSPAEHDNHSNKHFSNTRTSQVSIGDEYCLYSYENSNCPSPQRKKLPDSVCNACDPKLSELKTNSLGLVTHNRDASMLWQHSAKTSCISFSYEKYSFIRKMCERLLMRGCRISSLPEHAASHDITRCRSKHEKPKRINTPAVFDLHCGLEYHFVVVLVDRIQHENLKRTRIPDVYRLHHLLEDRFVQEKCHNVAGQRTEVSHPVTTQNSIYTVSRIVRTEHCRAKELNDSREKVITYYDDGDGLCDRDISCEKLVPDIKALESCRRIIQEDPEDLKLTQPPDFNPANKIHRVNTLRSIRLIDCSIENVSDAGFYLARDGCISCFRCGVRLAVADFQPTDPYHAKWHREPCNGNFGRIQSDGKVSDDARDPPGQQSVYIPSGDVRDERYRLSTFAKYPVSSPASKVNLARAGFYYTGYFDRVKCFSCGRTVERWEAVDDPTDSTWHKSNCSMQRGVDSGNIPIQSQFHIASSAPSRNQYHNAYSTNAQIGSAIYSRPSSSHIHQNQGNIVSHSQPSRQWKMANVTSSDHRRFLTNLFLNRELDRVASFARWPTGRPTVSITSLAKTGFFYLGDLDRTQCFSCGGVLRNWTANDSALSEHRAHFPDCQMVQGTETRNVPIPARPEPREERERNFPCRFPSNPHMRSEATRLDTFDRRWPSGRIQATPAEIAQAGFFFLGERDRAKCWYCNGGLQNWDYDDAPWVEHAKWFPNCQYLLKMKGQHFVYRHLAGSAHLTRPIIAKQEGATIDPSSYGQASSTSRSQDVPPAEPRNTSQSAAVPTIIDPREEITKRKELVQTVLKNSDLVKNIITMGFDRKIIEILLEEKLARGTQANNEDIYGSMVELLDDATAKEKEQKEEQERLWASEAAAARSPLSMVSSFPSAHVSPMSSYMATAGTVPGSGKYSAVYYDDDDDDDTMDVYGSTQPGTAQTREQGSSSAAVGATSNFRDTESMQEAMAKIEEDNLCKICFFNKADMLFIPCSHMCCCMDCTQAIRQCPLCREPIESAIKTYVS